MKNDCANRVSVIIPTYNRARFVGEAIESALAQTYRNMEVIVIDDGSTDNTQDVLKKYEGRICSISQNNAGVSSARNTGIKAASGDWIAFLDSDDVWLPQKLSLQMTEIKNHRNVCAHISNVSLVKVTGECSNHFTNCGDRYFSFKDSIRHLMYHHIFLTGAVFRKASIINAGYFNENLKMWEDFDLALRMTEQGPWFVTDTVLSKVIRRVEPPIDLTHVFIRSDKINAYYVFLDILTKFKNSTDVEKDTFKLINKKISSAYFDIAWEKNQKKISYFDDLIKSCKLRRSLKLYIKSVILLGGKYTAFFYKILVKFHYQLRR